MVAQLPDQLIGFRMPGILESRLDGDLNVLCILTFSKAVDRNNLGSILNGIAESYKGHIFPCLSAIQKISSI